MKLFKLVSGSYYPSVCIVKLHWYLVFCSEFLPIFAPLQLLNIGQRESMSSVERCRFSLPTPFLMICQNNTSF